jgi:hypothetical protein
MKRKRTIRGVLQDFVDATSGVRDDWLLSRLEDLHGEAVAALARRGATSRETLAPARDGWNPVETIPRRRKVLIKTVTGLDRVAKVLHDAVVSNGRIHCWRCDKGHTGDLRAIAWKELEQGEPK